MSRGQEQAGDAGRHGCGHRKLKLPSDDTASPEPDQPRDQTGAGAILVSSGREPLAAALGISGADRARNGMTMMRRVTIREAKTHLSALLAAVEGGEDLVICRGTTPVARVTRIVGEGGHAALSAALRRERAKQKTVTTAEILSWRHEGHAR